MTGLRTTLTALALMLACSADRAPLTKVAKKESSESAVELERACGQAGPKPTAFPEGLERGPQALGQVELETDDHDEIGPIRLHFKPKAWFGSRSRGHGGLGLVASVESSDPNEAQAGRPHEVEIGGAFSMQLGNYRLDARASDEDPPVLTVIGSRASCPHEAAYEPPEGSEAWAWISSNGIRRHVLRTGGRKVHAELSAIPQSKVVTLAVEITDGGTLRLDPVLAPGQTAVARGLGFEVAIDEVAAGEGTTFTEAGWEAAGTPIVHARLVVRPGAAEPKPVLGNSEASKCGEPVAVTAAIPEQLSAETKTRTVSVPIGATVKQGPWVLSYLEAKPEDPNNPRFRPQRRLYGQIKMVRTGKDGLEGAISAGAFRSGPKYQQAGRELLRLSVAEGSPASPQAVQIDILSMACIDSVSTELPPTDTSVWLSTHGTRRFDFQTPDEERTGMMLGLDDDRPTIQLGAARQAYSATVSSDVVGQTMQIGDRWFRIGAVETGADTSWQRGRYVSKSGPLPRVHVRIDILGPKPDAEPG